MNYALSSNGATASASSIYDAGRLPVAAINGDRKGIHWGTDPSSGSGWHCVTNNTYPDWLQVDFADSKTITEINVVTIQDNYANPVEPTEAMTFTTYGMTAFEAQYWNGSAWVTVPGGSVTGNNKVWRQFTFTPVTTNKIRVLVNNALAGYSRIVEVEAWSDPTATGLRGYWKFDENTGTTAADASGSGNTGTLTSGAGWSTGQSGAAVNLDGVNDYVQVGAQSSLVLTTAASISAWIYPTGPGSNSTYGGIIVNKEGEYELARYPNGTIQWAFANSNPGWNFINTGYVAPLNQWTHLAVTYDNGTIKTY
ncbi:MAG TPA: LamG-like jellyroll fold domain-containing protein, partial [Pyrinomonadaceae bacterium]|nr:LamG-like jellyroll fold domain-containing protein [Pyrinomonadaceae bacterium]